MTTVPVVDTRLGGNAPIWLLGVLDTRGGPTALVAIEPTTDEMHGTLSDRMRRGGFARVTLPEWNTGWWGLSRTAAVDVVRGDLVRITTGQASIYTGDTMPVTDRWLEAARARRACVALLVPGTLDGATDVADRQRRVAALVPGRRLLGTMAPVRFDLDVRRPA